MNFYSYLEAPLFYQRRAPEGLNRALWVENWSVFQSQRLFQLTQILFLKSLWNCPKICGTSHFVCIYWIAWVLLDCFSHNSVKTVKTSKNYDSEVPFFKFYVTNNLWTTTTCQLQLLFLGQKDCRRAQVWYYKYNPYRNTCVKGDVVTNFDLLCSKNFVIIFLLKKKWLAWA